MRHEDVYSAVNIVTVIKSRKMEGTYSTYEKHETCFKNISKFEGKRKFGRRDLDDKIILIEVLQKYCWKVKCG